MGDYKGRVIRVDSATRGEESEDATARLLALESDTETDVVIHVNNLKEGWDVRNLYTIVPLRASASDILTEQTLGRGLRLPYGVRTGVEAVDTLTIIAHDRFDEVIRAARDPEFDRRHPESRFCGRGWGRITARGHGPRSRTLMETALTGQGDSDRQADCVFSSDGERQAADFALRLISDRYERELKKGINQLSEPEVQARITRDVQEALAPIQTKLDLGEPTVNVAKVVAAVAAKITELTIAIPEIVVIPTREVTFGFRDFDLIGLEAIARQPISDEIMVQRLRDEVRTYLARRAEGAREERPENYLVRHLMDMPEVDYDSQSEFLFKLAGQMIARLRAYLPDEDGVENVLLVHGKDLARFIFEQMKQHYWETPTDYRATVARGFQLLRPQAFNVPNSQAVRNFRQPVVPAGDTRKHVFGGFQRCCYPYQRFQSNEEREFAVLIDSSNETAVLRWMKPGSRQFRIEYANGQPYEPDFVVETTTQKLIVEVKAANEMTDPIVQAKARAATKWVHYANAHASETGDKLWAYALVPHDAVLPSATLVGLMARYGLMVSTPIET